MGFYFIGEYAGTIKLRILFIIYKKHGWKEIYYSYEACYLIIFVGIYSGIFLGSRSN